MVRALHYNAVIALAIFILSHAPARAQENVPVESVPTAMTEVNAPSKSPTVEQKSARQLEIENRIQSQISEVKAASEEQPPTKEPDHIRGQIVSIKSFSLAHSIVVKTAAGTMVTIVLPEDVTILGLGKDSFTSVDFGAYVGAVGKRLDQYSPIVRDSMSWLHEGFELRFLDDELRGIALGEREWDLPADSIMAHGWIDDIEDRVISIKWGPTELEETDVEIGRDKPVFRMSLGNKNLIREGAHVFAGVEQDADGKEVAAFLIIGEGDLEPKL